MKTLPLYFFSCLIFVHSAVWANGATVASSATVKEICDGYKLIGAAIFRLKAQGRERPSGSHPLYVLLTNEIYSPTTTVNTEEMAETKTVEICIHYFSGQRIRREKMTIE